MEAIAKRRAGPWPATAAVQEVARVVGERIRKGGLVIVQLDVHPNPTTIQADLVLPVNAEYDLAGPQIGGQAQHGAPCRL